MNYLFTSYYHPGIGQPLQARQDPWDQFWSNYNMMRDVVYDPNAPLLARGLAGYVALNYHIAWLGAHAIGAVGAAIAMAASPAIGLPTAIVGGTFLGVNLYGQGVRYNPFENRWYGMALADANWSQAGQATLTGLELGFQFGAGMAGGKAIAGLTGLTANQRWLLGVGFNIFGVGMAWDVALYGQSPSEALLWNVAAFGIGEAVGYIASEALYDARRVIWYKIREAYMSVPANQTLTDMLDPIFGVMRLRMSNNNGALFETGVPRLDRLIAGTEDFETFKAFWRKRDWRIKNWSILLEENDAAEILWTWDGPKFLVYDKAKTQYIALLHEEMHMMQVESIAREIEQGRIPLYAKPGTNTPGLYYGKNDALRRLRETGAWGLTALWPEVTGGSYEFVMAARKAQAEFWTVATVNKFSRDPKLWDVYTNTFWGLEEWLPVDRRPQFKN